MDEYDRVFDVMTNTAESLGTGGLSKQDILPALVDLVPPSRAWLKRSYSQLYQPHEPWVLSVVFLCIIVHQTVVEAY